MKAKLLIIVLCVINSCMYAQTAENISVLNGFQKIVLKPKNKHNKFNADIEEVINAKLQSIEYPKPEDISILFTDKGSCCDLVTCLFSVENLSSRAVDLETIIEFINCQNETVFKTSFRESYSFLTKKTYTKCVESALDKAFGTYHYKYEKPVLPVSHNTENEKKESVPTEVVTENNVKQADNLYRGNGDPLKGLNVATAMDAIKMGNYYALIIGIDNYNGIWPKLKNAVSDAKTVQATLQNKYFFNTFKTLYNEAATRDMIISELEWLVANVKAEDNVFIYFSGHGEFNEKLNKGFWVPVDAQTNSVSKYISNNDIQTFLSGIRSKHTLLVADACFSGDLFRGKTMTIPYEDDFKYYHKVHALPSRKAISSGGIEPVMDGGRDGHSVFAYYFLKALTENDKKYFDASEVFDRIKIPIVNNSNQTPNFQPIKDSGDEGGQFIFIKK